MSDDDSDDQIIFGDIGDLKLRDICLTGGEKPRKNLTQESCPDRGSNPGPLRDRRACCHLAHSGGLQTGPGVHSASYKMSTRCVLRGYRRPSVGPVTLPLPSALAVNMWTLASTSSVGLHGL